MSDMSLTFDSLSLAKVDHLTTPPVSYHQLLVGMQVASVIFTIRET